MASAERWLLVAGFVTAAGTAASFGAHQYYESNIAPLTEGAIRDADKESPPVPQAKLAMALKIRNDYLNDLPKRLSGTASIDPTVPFGPERIREESSRPEVLQAKITLAEQSKNVDALTRIRAEQRLDLKESAGHVLQFGTMFVTGVGSVYSLMLGVLVVGNRRFRNRSLPAEKYRVFPS